MLDLYHSRGCAITDLRQHAPATDRNREPILAVLKPLLPSSGDVLEIASGTGQHAAHFATALPHLRWRPTDADPGSLASIKAWTDAARVDIADPVLLDVCQTPWPVEPADAIFCANMIHITPWAATEGLFRGGETSLRPGGVLVLYGPFKIDGQHTAPSNVQFERWLHDRDPRYGVRDLGDVSTLGKAHGFSLMQTVEMPANNKIVAFRRVG